MWSVKMFSSFNAYQTLMCIHQVEQVEAKNYPFSFSRILQWLQERAPKAWFACGSSNQYNVKGEEGFQKGETISEFF